MYETMTMMLMGFLDRFLTLYFQFLSQLGRCALQAELETFSMFSAGRIIRQMYNHGNRVL